MVFDCVAVQRTVDQAVAMADKGGTVVVVGVPAKSVTVPLPVIQDHQMRIQGSATYLPEDYAEAISLLLNGAVRAEDIVTAEHPMEAVDTAFGDSAGGDQIKVLVLIDEHEYSSAPRS